jgi:hypothetical protein
MITLCAQCGKPFATGRTDARFCSATCRSHRHRGISPKPWAGPGWNRHLEPGRDLSAAIAAAWELGYRVEFLLVPMSNTAGSIEDAKTVKELEALVVKIAEQRLKPLPT